MKIKSPKVYRTITTKNGSRMRYAYRGNTLVEVKNLTTGATHTEKEFENERKQQNKRI